VISRPIQVALSGSGFLLPVHVGALQAIEDAGYAISALSGTSGGAIVAAIYAVQQDAQKLADLVLATDWRPFMDFESWTNGWRLLTRRGICATTALDTFLIQQTEGQSFADLSMELFICATNLLRGERRVFSRATTPDLPIATAARASSSLPFVYPPKRIQNRYYVDGGLTDNIPGNILRVFVICCVWPQIFREMSTFQSRNNLCMGERVSNVQNRKILCIV